MYINDFSFKIMNCHQLTTTVTYLPSKGQFLLVRSKDSGVEIYGFDKYDKGIGH